MPPPYWRSGGAWFQLHDALDELVGRLEELVPIHADVEAQIAEYFDRYPAERNSETEEAMERFRDMCHPLWEAEHRVKLKCDLVILMAAIFAEELINRFCVFNLPRELVEALEKLSPSEKMTAAASHLGTVNVRSTAAFAAMVSLSGWRNAFAHGHCVDRPAKTLRHNHLILPAEYAGIPDGVETVVKQLAGLVKIIEYLASISINPYTASSSETSPFVYFMGAIRRFRFSGERTNYELQIRESGA